MGLVAGGEMLYAGGANAAGLAAPVAQGEFPTPTPGPDGRIIYIVREGDTAWTIAAVAGLSLQELYALNGLQPTDFLRPGGQLILGLGGPARPTAGPSTLPTQTPVPPTPTPTFGTGEICVLLFHDRNGNARYDAGEEPIAAGQLSVTDVTGAETVEHATDGTTALSAFEEPIGFCFMDLESGDYNISAAVPVEYNPTTAMNLPIRLNAGEVKYVEFAAQASGGAGGPTPAGGSRSTVLGILGLGLLLGAAGLGYYAMRLNRKSPSSLR
ncbi:MAG: LysM peptidoglycan-binding domain-containing protein [Anaerolineales bacterium]|nr:LysM peptidoglycan-binding domain-containing protein [Anaerolineales bacterium]